MISFIYYGSSYKIVVFFENPWSSMRGAGIAFLPITANLGKTTYDKMFSDWRDYKRTLTNRSQVNGGWFRGSYFIETDRLNLYNVNHVVRLA